MNLWKHKHSAHNMWLLLSSLAHFSHYFPVSLQPSLLATWQLAPHECLQWCSPTFLCLDNSYLSFRCLPPRSFQASKLGQVSLICAPLLGALCVPLFMALSFYGNWYFVLCFSYLAPSTTVSSSKTGLALLTVAPKVLLPTWAECRFALV
jgi:hypothetical protein